MGRRFDRRAGWVAAVLAGAALGALLASALAIEPAGASSGTLILTRNTTLTEDHQGDIIIAADGITLDCAGHRLVGDGLADGILVRHRSGVAIRNCRILGFRRGVAVESSSRIGLEANHSSENEIGYWIASSDHLQAHSNTAAENRQSGFLLTFVHASLFTNNRALDNTLSGYLMTDTDGVTMTANNAEGNGQVGFHLVTSDDNELLHNAALRNETGFLVEQSWRNLLEANVASENRGDGVRLVGDYLHRLARNTATRNGGRGFSLEGSLGVTLSDSVAQENAAEDLAVVASSAVEVLGAQTTRAPGAVPPSFGRYMAELVSFLGLASSIWLGVYLVGQPERGQANWLTAMTLWSVSATFLEDFLTFNQPAIGLTQQLAGLFSFLPGASEAAARFVLLGWLEFPSAALWFHATALLAPGGMTAGRKALAAIGYLLSLVAIGVDLVLPGTLDSSFSGSAQGLLAGGYPFAIVAGYRLLFGGLAVLNLIWAARAAQSEILRRQFRLLIAAAGVGVLAVVIYALRGTYDLVFPAASEALLLWLAVVLLGYGVGQLSAVVPGRTVRRHFVASLIAVGAVTLLYFLVSYLSSIAFAVRTAAFAFVILLAVVTHSLAGNARSILDYFFGDPETRKILQLLRRFPAGLGSESRLEDRLNFLLDHLCTRLRATYGLVLLAADGSLRVAAADRWDRTQRLTLGLGDLANDDLASLAPGALPAPLEEAALLAPLYVEAEQVGAIVLGQPANSTSYSADEVELAGYASDRMAELLSNKRIQDGALRHVSLASEPRPVLAAGADRDPSIGSVEQALRRMNDFPYLGGCPLADLAVVSEKLKEGPATHIDRGKAVHQVLTEAVYKLRPEGKQPTEATREWHHFMVLHEAYLMDRPNREVMAELYISEGTFNRRRREAIDAVTQILREQEEVLASPA